MVVLVLMEKLTVSRLPKWETVDGASTDVLVEFSVLGITVTVPLGHSSFPLY